MLRVKMEWFTFLFFSSFLLIFIHGVFHYAFWLSHKRKFPPGPNGLPIIGSLLQLGNKPHESLSKLAKIHGPLMTVRLGFITTVVASSPDMAKEILKKNDHALSGRTIPNAATAETDYDMSITWLPNGPQWRNLRKLCNNQMFTTQRLDDLQGLRDRMMEEMMQHLVEVSEAGETLNVGRLVFGTTLNLLSNTMFSINMIDLNSKSVQELKDVIARIMEFAGKPNFGDYFPLLQPLDLQGIKRDIKVSYDRLHALLDDIIGCRLQERESGCPRYDDFLDVLIDHSQEHGSDFSRRDIKLLLTALFIGGTDTTTTTMEWAMAELLHNPNKMVKAQKELAETIGPGQHVKESDISRLPYLQAVLKEAMRLHPTTPFLLPHRAETDVEVCGFTIPKHTQVLVNSWAITRDSNFWDNPTCFMPERFLGSDVDFRARDFTFIPFSMGRRMCPGLPLAIRMVNLLLASLLHHFHWKLPGGMEPEQMDMKEKFGITLQKEIPLLAIPSVIAAERSLV